MRDRLIEAHEIEGHVYHKLAQRLFSYRSNLNERIVHKLDGKIISREVYQRAIGEPVRKVELGECQICERPIGVKAGVIAHHGYRRPGHGRQTSSCYGARRLDWAHDRQALGEWIAILRRDAMNQELAIMTMRWAPHRIEIVPGRRDRKGLYHEAQFVEPGGPDYLAYQRRWFERHEREARELQTEAERQQARYDGWRQTGSVGKTQSNPAGNRALW